MVDEPVRADRAARLHPEPRQAHDRLRLGLAKASGGVLTSVGHTTLKPGAPGFYEMPALEG
jgi:hypothetical protein